MKTLFYMICLILLLNEVAFLLALGIGPSRANFLVEAPVLSINENITEGRLIGALLSSPDGNFSTDIIKVGVAVEVSKGTVRLYDLKLSHAELAYYRQRSSIPLSVRIYRRSMDRVTFFLNGKEVYEEMVPCLPISRDQFHKVALENVPGSFLKLFASVLKV